MGSNARCPRPAHKCTVRCYSVCRLAIPPSSKGITRGARPVRERETLTRFIQGKGRGQLRLSGLESEAGQAHGTWKGTEGAAQEHWGCTRVRRPAPGTTKSCRIACSMQVCPSVPPSGAELQCPRATQPGQFWEQLESAARDEQKMPFFSWQEDFLDLSHTL